MKLPLPFYTKILAQEFSIIEFQNELNYQSHIFTTKDETGEFFFFFFFLRLCFNFILFFVFFLKKKCFNLYGLYADHPLVKWVDLFINRV